MASVQARIASSPLFFEQSCALSGSTIKATDNKSEIKNKPSVNKFRRLTKSMRVTKSVNLDESITLPIDDNRFAQFGSPACLVN